MTPTQPLEIYKASAGSGKTNLLTTQYLQLILESPNKFTEILAVTFTNKATEEMKHRILSELKLMADGKPTRMAAQLVNNAKGITAAGLQAKASSTYSAILHNYSRFSITTIDSFVQQTIRSFAYEIGLDACFKIQLNTDVVKEDLTKRLYQLLNTNPALQHWVIRMAIERLAEGKNWDFKEDMLELASELFKERFQQFSVAMAALSADETELAFNQLQKNINHFLSQFHTEQAQMGKAGIALIEANQLTPADFSYGKNGFIHFFYKAANNSIDKVGKRVSDFVERPEKATSSKDVFIKTTIHGLAPQLHRMMVALVQHFEQNRAKVYTAQAIKQSIYTLQTVQVFNQQLANYRSDNNMLLGVDATILLKNLASQNDAAFIFEKIGNTYRHFLIDEFQDTSFFQWVNFKPMIQNSLAQGNYNLIVGDVKQAIYRWRSGDWRLLLYQVKKELKNLLVTENTLQQNFRSSTFIIDFNNYLFASLPLLLQQKFNNDMNEAPPAIRQQLENNGYFQIIENAYADSFQQTPPSATIGGLVQIQFVETEADDEGETVLFVANVLSKLPLQIEHLINVQGYAAADIGILTRGNKEARQVVECLMAHQQNTHALQYQIVSADALLIGANQGVQIIMAAIQLLINPDDAISKAFLIKTMAARNESNLSPHQIFASNGVGASLLPPAITQQRAALQALPLLDLVSELIAIFHLQQVDSDLAYLLSFQDLVLEWSRFGEDGLHSFLKYWAADGQKKSLPNAKASNAVEVLTIHKSKGLAYNVVLLPFCNWALEPDAKLNNWLWVHAEKSSFNQLPFVPIKYKKEVGKSEFAYDFFEEQLLSQMDALNMLYVATTRARQHIIAYAPCPAQKTNADDVPIKTIGDLLFLTFKNEATIHNKNIKNVQPHFSQNTFLFGAAIKPENQPQPAHESIRPTQLVYHNWKQQLHIRPAILLQNEAAILPRTKGTLLHHALAQLQHPSALNGVLHLMQSKGMITDVLKKEMKTIIEKLLENPLLFYWQNNTMKKISERDIVTTGKQLKRPDLVLTHAAETLVIDFKFTESKDPKFKKQVEEYVLLLQQMHFKNVKGYLLYGFTNEAELV